MTLENGCAPAPEAKRKIQPVWGIELRPAPNCRGCSGFGVITAVTTVRTRRHIPEDSTPSLQGTGENEKTTKHDVRFFPYAFLPISFLSFFYFCFFPYSPLCLYVFFFCCYFFYILLPSFFRSPFSTFLFFPPADMSVVFISSWLIPFHIYAISSLLLSLSMDQVNRRHRKDSSHLCARCLSEHEDFIFILRGFTTVQNSNITEAKTTMHITFSYLLYCTP
jgi:hypothetical protein